MDKLVEFLEGNTSNDILNLSSRGDPLIYQLKHLSELNNDCNQRSILLNIKKITYNNNAAKNLKWLKYFPNLMILDCSYNYFNDNSLKFLKYVPNLRILSIISNEIKTLTDISFILPNLQELCCSNNKLIYINISNCTSLQLLNCSFNCTTELIIQNTPKLRYIYCQNNKLISLVVSECKKLEVLLCMCNSLTELNLQNLKLLQSIYCYSNKINTLDIKGCNSLSVLECSQNKLIKLELHGLIKLEYIFCENNLLIDIINISDASKLRSLHCNDNQLISLDLSNALLLKYLYCYNNKSLNIEKIKDMCKHLNLEIFNDTNMSFTNYQGSDKCCICLDYLNDHPDEILEAKIITGCKHIFHSICLQTWINIYVSNCPYCRQLI